MPKDSAKVRLPELPVFKKYSLALRQEFASVDEILSVLDRTTTKIRESVERADEERRRQDQAAIPELENKDEEFAVDPVVAEEPLNEEDVEDSERPFWEEPWQEDISTPTSSRSPLEGDKAERPSKPRAKVKTRRAKPSVVRVGHHGKPLTPKKASPKKSASKKAGPKKAASKKAASKKAAPKKATRKAIPKKKSLSRTPVSSRAKPKSRAGSRRK